nr:MAG TPA: hypothetical protein [Caudoviricetes sp.]
MSTGRSTSWTVRSGSSARSGASSEAHSTGR